MSVRDVLEIDDNAPLDEARTLLREYVAGLPVPVEIPAYWEHPVPNVVFYELTL